MAQSNRFFLNGWFTKRHRIFRCNLYRRSIYIYPCKLDSSRRKSQLLHGEPLTPVNSDGNNEELFTQQRKRVSKQYSTPLARQLAEVMRSSGPCTIAQYMRSCLTSCYGYYTSLQAASWNNDRREIFGRKGDFITSPEICQVFGELVGIWFLTQWIGQGRKSNDVNLIELGAGRGTLMSDILRTIARFPEFSKLIKAIYLVEVSTPLRIEQHRTLCGEDAPMQEGDFLTIAGCESGQRSQNFTYFTAKSNKFLNNVPIVWTPSLRFVPGGRVADGGQSITPFIIAHEFFDALPIHAFKSVKIPANLKERKHEKSEDDFTNVFTTGNSQKHKSTIDLCRNYWLEYLVVPADGELIDAKENTQKYLKTELGEMEFRLVVSKKPTIASLKFPEILTRYKKAKCIEGATIEISPEALNIIAEIAHRIGKSRGMKFASGAALIIDYGPVGEIPKNSLRGFTKHQRVNPFIRPGEIDLSVDVDFGSLAEAALLASDWIEVHGPVNQADWLRMMGGELRVQNLVNKLNGKNDLHRSAGAERLLKAWSRLTDRNNMFGMGNIYKAMAIVPLQSDNMSMRNAPVGFGGDVVDKKMESGG